MSQRQFEAQNIVLLKISDTRTETTDDVGDMFKDMIEADGHRFVERQIVPDDRFHIRAAVSQWLVRDDIDVIFTTGGTGVTARDVTPEAIRPLLDKEISGIGELFRFLSYEQIKTSTIQSRALGGVANGKIVFVAPGSKGAVQDMWTNIAREQLDSRVKPCNLVMLKHRLLEK
ncbi:MAG: molybdenum cofactor biosynthesis protein [Pseudobacteriovorax sp.]|nr:molybdenum cofactor biosynthesis protein [Pseudobacteriovorax sp.]